MNGIYALIFGTIMLLVAFVRAIRSLIIVIAMAVTKTMKWFKPFGWLYRPVSLPGYGILFIFTVFCLHIFFAALMQSHSLGSALYASFPFVIPAFGLYLWVGSKAS
jgi:hypothetical protein